MDQYDYLTREQLISLIRVLGAGPGGDRGPAPANPEGLPEFGERARRDFERSASPMRIFDHETFRFLAVNDAAVKFYGYSREESFALTLKDTRHPDEHAAQLASLKEASGYLRYGGPRRHIKKSGEIAVVEVVTQDILFNGRKARLTLTIDLTARVRMQELLRQRQQEFESLAENLPDLVARYDRNGRFLYVNSAIETALGAERGNLMGRTQREVGLPAELAALYDESLAGVFATGVPHKVEFRLAAAGGERRYEAHHVAEFDAAGKIGSVLCVARDITGHKQAEFEAQRGAEMARLLESLARAVNEAVTPEAAMAMCLERICAHGGWMIGRVALYSDAEPGSAPSRSIWHAADQDRFAEFMAFSNRHAPAPGGAFLSRVLGKQVAVWIEDIGRNPGFTRKAIMMRCGLRSAFAFPIIVRDAVVALMEVFGDESRPQDPLILGAAQSLASQLARIVERGRAHEANAKLAAIVESSQDAIISRALDGTILTWNAAAERLFGYTASEVVGRKIEIIYPQEIKSDMFRKQRLLLEEKAVPTFETMRLAKDGRRIHVSTSPAPIRDSSGTISGVSTIIRDITERKLAEQALHESEERFRQLAENIDRVFWINTPATDNNLYVSPAYEKIWGKSLESLRRHPNSWKESIHPEDQLRAREAAVRLAAEGVHMDVEYRIIRPDGTIRWIRDRSYPMRAGDGTPLVCGIAEDITVRKQAEQERLTHAIHQRDALVREVHHRIKNNLQGVIGLLRQKFRKYPAAGPEIEEAITQLQTVAAVYGLQGGRADGLLGLAEMVEAICAAAESLTGGHVDRTFERRSARPVCVAGADAVSVAVALNELMFNALKHQPARAGSKRASVLLREADGVAEIRIANRGQLPGEFDYAAGRALGTGLGLVRTLLASPGSDVQFSNGRGRVEVRLKLAPPLLAGQQQWLTRRRVDGATGTKKAAAARAGRGRRPAGAGRAG